MHKFLVRTAILIAVLVGGVIAYQTFVIGRPPGDTAYLEGDQFFEDGLYARAMQRYDDALAQAPDHFHARRARARTLMQLGQLREALAEYDVLIATQPDFTALYTNRGVLHDRMGNYEKAIEDYEFALTLEPEIDKGPHWLVRFLRNQPEKPTGIADRAAYLRDELAKPASERLLRIPELDAKQRSFKQ